jgi:hypothetical protein
MLSLLLLGGTMPNVNDIYHIEDRLREIDHNILRIDFDYDREMHKVVAVDKMGTQYTAMMVKHGELDARVVSKFQRIDPRKFNPFDEVDQWLQKKDRDDEKKIEDMSRNMADLLHKPLIQDAFYR